MKNLKALNNSYCKIVDNRKTNSGMYVLVEFSIPREMGIKARNRMLHDLLVDTGATGLIEWWKKGSIVDRDMRRFPAIFLFERG